MNRVPHVIPVVGHVFSFALCTSDAAAFAHVVSPGVGAFPNFIVARGLGSSVPQDDPWAFGTRVFERWMSLSGRTRPLSKPKLPAKGKQ